MSTTIVPSDTFREAKNAVIRGDRKLPLDEETKLPIEDWRELGYLISGRSETSLWQLAQWLLYGEWEYKDFYTEAKRITKLDYQRLADLKSVAGKFSCQHENLSFTHHQEVAGLPTAADREAWLDLAERNEWSCAQLREALTAAKATPDKPRDIVKVIYHLTAQPEDDAILTSAAERHGMEVRQWILHTAVEVARLELKQAA